MKKNSEKHVKYYGRRVPILLTISAYSLMFGNILCIILHNNSGGGYL